MRRIVALMSLCGGFVLVSSCSQVVMVIAVSCYPVVNNIVKCEDRWSNACVCMRCVVNVVGSCYPVVTNMCLCLQWW